MALISGCRSRNFTPVQAPNIELKDLADHTVSLASFKGHPVLLDFWATWCGPCQISVPMVQRFYAAHKDQGLVVLGINVDDDPSGVYPFVKHFKMTYPILYGGGSSVSEDYGVDGIPMFIFIDKDGRVVQRYDGFRPDMAEEWEHQFQLMTAAH